MTKTATTGTWFDLCHDEDTWHTFKDGAGGWVGLCNACAKQTVDPRALMREAWLSTGSHGHCETCDACNQQPCRLCAGSLRAGPTSPTTSSD